MSKKSVYSLYREMVTARADVQNAKSRVELDKAEAEHKHILKELDKTGYLSEANELYRMMQELDNLMDKLSKEKSARLKGLLDRKITNKEEEMFKLKNRLKEIYVEQ